MRRSVIQPTSLALLLATAMAGASAQPSSTGLGRLNVNKSIEVQAESGLQNVVTRYGENRSVPVSADQPNMILTPFADPNVVGDGVGFWGCGQLRRRRDNETKPELTPLRIVRVARRGWYRERRRETTVARMSQIV